MTEREAWLWLAALIEGTKGEAFVDSYGDKLGGLCFAIDLMNVDRVIDDNVSWYAKTKIRCALKGRSHLARRYNWTNGVRLHWCLEFAEQCK
jgi:hypothetical protein